MKKIKIYLLIATVYLVSCKKETEKEPINPVTPGGETVSTVININFSGPTYPNDYSSIGGWENRQNWQLANIHDPSIAKQGEYFYMVQTDASYGNVHEGKGHFFMRRSKDLVNWEFIGPTMKTVPNWVADSLNLRRNKDGLPPLEKNTIRYGFWAPNLRKVGNIYRIYYSIVILNPIIGEDSDRSWSERPFIGLMETSDLSTNEWIDKGMVVCNIADGVEDYRRLDGNDWSSYWKFNSIDPSFIETPEGDQYLFYGSWMTGLAYIKLDPSTGKPKKLMAEEDYGTRIVGRGDLSRNRWQGLEGPEIIYNPETGYYYLFLAYDELSIAYNTRVARSKSIEGPYLGYNGQNVSDGAECFPMLTHPYKFNNSYGWVGFSHCAIIHDVESGKWFYSSQGRLPENVGGNAYSNAIMMGHIRELKWTSDGWPVIDPERYAAVPQIPLTENEILGKWEHINFDYQYQKQQTSSIVYFDKGNKTSGSFNTTWSYDDQTKTLKIGGWEVKLFITYDWEVNPRRVTLTYSGYNAEGKPVWGKKIF